MLPKLTLVLGGAASGKSCFAEALVVKTDAPRIYIATAQAFDDEMRTKIAQHRTARGDNWQTIEAPMDVAEVLHQSPKNKVVLLDCATLWLSNHLLAGSDLGEECSRLGNALRDCDARIVVVSNEIGQSGVPDNAMARQFRIAQGHLNQQIAASADLVVAVMAGLPLVIKGKLP